MTLVNDIATTYEHELGATGTVQLETVDTEIRLRGVPGTTVRIRLAHGDLGAEFRIDAQGDRVDVRPIRRWLFGRRRDIGPLEVEVPTGASVRAATASGAILALDLTTAIDAKTASGPLDLAGVAGEIRAETVSGAIRVRASGAADLALRTVSGSVDAVARSARSIATRAISGTVRLATGFDGHGPYGIETVSGDVTLAAGGPIQLRASSVSGGIDLPDGRSNGPGPQRTLAIGGSGPLVDVRTVSGRVRLQRWRPEADALDPVAATSGPGPAVGPVGETDSAAPGATDSATHGAPAADFVAPDPGTASHDAAEATEDPRLPILRALQRGDIDVAEAERLLVAVEASDG